MTSYPPIQHREGWPSVREYAQAGLCQADCSWLSTQDGEPLAAPFVILVLGL